MNLKKRFIILLSLAVAILIIIGGSGMFSKKQINFFKLSEQENFDNLSLTIYYVSPFILTRHPLRVDDLITMSIVRKVVINGSSLEEHIDLFKQISNDDLIPVEKKSYLDARVYYVLESKENGKLFDVVMWGGHDNSIFVNGVEVKENDIFYDVIKPFLSEDEIKELESYLNRGKQE